MVIEFLLPHNVLLFMVGLCLGFDLFFSRPEEHVALAFLLDLSRQVADVVVLRTVLYVMVLQQLRGLHSCQLSQVFLSVAQRLN